MKTIATLLLVLASAQALATADSLQKVAIPHVHNLQDPPDFNYNAFNTQPNTVKKFCITKALFWDAISSSAMGRLYTATNNYHVPMYNSPNTFPPVNINSASNPGISYIYTYNSIDNYVQSGGQYVHEPSLTIDVSAMPQSTADERLEALTHAKLALLAVTRTLRYPYRATINVTGLPSQAGISRPSFTSVHASTNWPYTDSSTLLSNYESELLSANCQ
ncbi:MAG: hypothetical protein ACRBBP_09795 [Bdellovibrionales bacterium]